MIWFVPRPWANRRERDLFVAALSSDDQVALSAALRWFGAMPNAEIGYRHHRLIAAVGHRFSGRSELAAHRSLITSVSKQLWLRGARVMATLARLSQTFETMGVPWTVMGNAVWQCLSNPRFRDVERVEIVVAAEAFSYAMSRLWDIGWQPYAGTKTYSAPDPVELVDGHRSVVSLQSDRAMLAADPDLNAGAIWGSLERVVVFGGIFPLPPEDLMLRFRDASPSAGPDDFQWAVDLAELMDRGHLELSAVPAKFKSLKKRAQLLQSLREG